MSSFLSYRKKAETYQTRESTSPKLPGRQWHVWDSPLPCCHTTFYILIQTSIRRVDEIVMRVTKSWSHLCWTELFFGKQYGWLISIREQRRDSYEKQKQKKVNNRNNSQPVLELQGRKILMWKLRRNFCFPCQFSKGGWLLYKEQVQWIWAIGFGICWYICS